MPRDGLRWTAAQVAGVAAILGLAAAGAGCARFEPKPISLAENLDTFQARILADPGLRAYLETNGLASNWPRQSWDVKALTLAAFL